MRNSWFLLLLLFGEVPAFAQQQVVSVLDSNVIKTLFFAGLKDKMNENYPKALESFNKVLIIDANNAAAHYEIATLNFRQNKLNESETAAIRATVLDANNLWYWKLLAELYKRKGDMEDLVPVFDHLIRLAPENDAYYFDRCNALLLSGKVEEALKGYDDLEKKFGASDALKQARQRVSMEKKDGMGKQEVSKLISEDEDVKSLLYASSVLLEKGQHADALNVLKKARSLDADAFEVDLAIADVYKGLKKYAEVQAALMNAFENPEMPADQKVKIVMMMLNGTRSKQLANEATELAKIAVKVHPDKPGVMALYGDILFRQGDLNGALAQFNEVLKSTDQIYQVWEQVLNIHTTLGMHKEAIKVADEAMSIYPNQAILYYYMALALENEVKLDLTLEIRFSFSAQTHDAGDRSELSQPQISLPESLG
ncbi:MAG: tetratricopeptide repeat protein [Pedobacter sp.]|nr:MAG: tetratricopeptide repeat protein [Pedobacter sp.]